VLFFLSFFFCNFLLLGPPDLGFDEPSLNLSVIPFFFSFIAFFGQCVFSQRLVTGYFFLTAAKDLFSSRSAFPRFDHEPPSLLRRWADYFLYSPLSYFLWKGLFFFPPSEPRPSPFSFIFSNGSTFFLPLPATAPIRISLKSAT